jgi:hypothetical protein
MKKILFSLCFFSFMIVGAQAQKASCAKSCTKGTAASAAACQAKAPSVATAESVNAAAKVASMDASIETRTDPGTGAVTYVRKETCSHSGTVSYVDVTFDESTNTFVNVSPVHGTGKSAGCGTAKAASAGGKGCCASGASAGKSCCASKGAAAKTAEKVKS